MTGTNALELVKREVGHAPTLDTVLMVEDFCNGHSGEYTKTGLWKALPRRVMYQTYKTIIECLRFSGKIAIDKKGVVVWVWNPKLVEKYLRRPGLEWKPG